MLVGTRGVRGYWVSQGDTWVLRGSHVGIGGHFDRVTWGECSGGLFV